MGVCVYYSSGYYDGMVGRIFQNIPDSTARMDLIIVAANGDFEAVKSLLTCQYYPPYIRSIAKGVANIHQYYSIVDFIRIHHSKEMTDLFSAATRGDVAQVENLLSEHEYAPATVDKVFALALEGSRISILRYLIHRDMNIVEHDKISGFNLAIAAKSGSIEAVKLLISVGNYTSEAKSNALVEAVMHRGGIHSLAVSKYLCDKGVKMERAGYAFKCAIVKGQTEIVKYFIAKEYPDSSAFMYSMSPSSLSLYEDFIHGLERERSIISQVSAKRLGMDMANLIAKYH